MKLGVEGKRRLRQPEKALGHGKVLAAGDILWENFCDCCLTESQNDLSWKRPQSSHPPAMGRDVTHYLGIFLLEGQMCGNQSTENHKMLSSQDFSECWRFEQDVETSSLENCQVTGFSHCEIFQSLVTSEEQHFELIFWLIIIRKSDHLKDLR